VTARDAWPLVDWIEPLRTDDDFPERTAEIDAVLDAVERLLGEIERLAESDEVRVYAGMLGSAIFGPHTGIEIEVDDEDERY
jgi:hypothetical protein